MKLTQEIATVPGDWQVGFFIQGQQGYGHEEMIGKQQVIDRFFGRKKMYFVKKKQRAHEQKHIQECWHCNLDDAKLCCFCFFLIGANHKKQQAK